MRKIIVLSALAAMMCLGCDDSTDNERWDDEETCTTGRCDKPGNSAQTGNNNQNTGNNGSQSGNNGSNQSGNSGDNGTGQTDNNDQTGNNGDSGSSQTGSNNGSDDVVIIDAPTGCTTEGKTENGEGCRHNCDCKSKICVNYRCAASNAHQSTISSSAWTGNGEREASEQCSQDSHCSSGLCMNGKCSDECDKYGCSMAGTVCRYNKCIPLSADGGECDASNYKTVCAFGQFCCNGFCSSGKCESGVVCSDFEADICDAGCVEMAGWDGKICGCKNVGACGDSMYCSTSDTVSYKDARNICLSKKKNGSDCHLNEECMSGICYNKSSSTLGTLTGYCTDPVEIGKPCYLHGQCASGYCRSEECKPSRKEGEGCTASINCEKGLYCNRSECQKINP